MFLSLPKSRPVYFLLCNHLTAMFPQSSSYLFKYEWECVSGTFGYSVRSHTTFLKRLSWTVTFPEERHNPCLTSPPLLMFPVCVWSQSVCEPINAQTHTYIERTVVTDSNSRASWSAERKTNTPWHWLTFTSASSGVMWDLVFLFPAWDKDSLSSSYCHQQ